jgi:hypothetical protein
VGFEPTISAGERPQTHALDRAATGTGNLTVKSRTTKYVPVLNVMFALSAASFGHYGIHQAIFVQIFKKKGLVLYIYIYSA